MWWEWLRTGMPTSDDDSSTGQLVNDNGVEVASCRWKLRVIKRMMMKMMMAESRRKFVKKGKCWSLKPPPQFRVSRKMRSRKVPPFNLSSRGCENSNHLPHIMSSQSQATLSERWMRFRAYVLSAEKLSCEMVNRLRVYAMFQPNLSPQPPCAIALAICSTSLSPLPLKLTTMS